MKMQGFGALRWVSLLALGMSSAHAAPGFLVAAPDRGFSGNEAVRDGVDAFASEHPARLVFVTGDGTAERLDQALRALQEANAAPVVLLPFYLSRAHPDMAQLRNWLPGRDVTLGRLFGRSAAAPAALANSLRAIEAPVETKLALVGHGATTETEADQMRHDLQQLLDWAAQGMSFASANAHVWANVDEFGQDEYRRHLAEISSGNPHPGIVLPFHLGPDLDSMMGFTPRLQNAAPDGVKVLDSGTVLQSSMSLWLAREAARYRALDDGDIGVVVHAHGSSWQWNETMRQGAAPLADDFLVEYAFSMGDPETLEHAVRHLEERGARAVVIVRVFGMADSFRDGIVRFIGQSWESCQPLPPANPQGHHGGHSSGGSPSPLLETRLPVVTVGGLEDHPLFAEALWQRTLALSERPERETVILVAHGLGTEEGNKHWRQVLESIRDQMIALGGDRFRTIDVALWSEDWPDLRQSAVEHVRGLVEKGNEDNGRVLVIPARTLGQGSADRYLDGLDYVLGEGFAPHPLFAEWLRLQARAGKDRLLYEADERLDCADDDEHRQVRHH